LDSKIKRSTWINPT